METESVIFGSLISLVGGGATSWWTQRLAMQKERWVRNHDIQSKRNDLQSKTLMDIQDVLQELHDAAYELSGNPLIGRDRTPRGEASVRGQQSTSTLRKLRERVLDEEVRRLIGDFERSAGLLANSDVEVDRSTHFTHASLLAKAYQEAVARIGVVFRRIIAD